MPFATRRRSRLTAIACAILLLAANGCAGGDAGGAPFDPNGTLDDLAAVAAAFDDPAVAAFSAASGAIDAALAAPVDAPAVGLLGTHDDAAFGARGREFVLRTASYAHLRPGAPRTGPVAALPTPLLGATFTWEPALGRYVPTNRPGAPLDGVRFELFAADPATGRPALPLVPAGQADLRDVGRDATRATEVTVARAGAVPLTYVIASTEGAHGAVVSVAGRTGADAVRFRLTSSFDARLAGARLDIRLDAPARGLSLDWALGLHDLAGRRPVDVDVLMSGPHGNVVLEGGLGADGAGTLGVLANGVAFARIARSAEGGPAASRLDGTPLAPSEQGALLGILAMVNEGGALFNRLLEPADNVVR
jgi:hypothetical protein